MLPEFKNTVLIFLVLIAIGGALWCGAIAKRVSGNFMGYVLYTMINVVTAGCIIAIVLISKL